MEGWAVLISIAVIGGQILNIVALVRTYKTPEWVYGQLGKDRNSQRGKHWIGVFLVGLGALFGWHWQLTIRPELERAKAGPGNSRASWPAPSQGISEPSRSQAATERPKQSETQVAMESSVTWESDSEPSGTIEGEFEGRALQVERSEVLRFSSVSPVSKQEVEDAAATTKSVFRVSQELLTGMLLSERLKEGGKLQNLGGLELTKYFLEGNAVGRLLFGFSPKQTALFPVSDTHEMSLGITAALEDSEYFYSIAFKTLVGFLDTLPSGVGQYLSESLRKAGLSELETQHSTRMFASGIAYLGFQAPTRPEEPTW